MCWRGLGEQESREPAFVAWCETEMGEGCAGKQKTCKEGVPMQAALLMSLDAVDSLSDEGEVPKAAMGHVWRWKR